MTLQLRLLNASKCSQEDVPGFTESLLYSCYELEITTPCRSVDRLPLFRGEMLICEICEVTWMDINMAAHEVQMCI